jgi:hypothetical protein
MEMQNYGGINYPDKINGGVEVNHVDKQQKPVKGQDTPTKYKGTRTVETKKRPTH